MAVYSSNTFDASGGTGIQLLPDVPTENLGKYLRATDYDPNRDRVFEPAVIDETDLFTGDKDIAGVLSVNQISGRGAAPTVEAGVGLGTGGTVTLDDDSTDLEGEITFTSGTTPTADGIVATITLTTEFSKKPRPIFFPSNDNAASLFSGQEDGAPMIYAESTTETVVVKVNGTLPEATPYKCNYRL